MARVHTEDDKEISSRHEYPASPIAPLTLELPPLRERASREERHVENTTDNTPHAERYVLVTTLVDQRHANLACSTLESNGVQIMVEHIRLQAGSVIGTAFRILTPLSSVQSALRILARLGLTRQENDLDENESLPVNAA